jgi:CRP/FNR family transcriptional regulator, cyclic AMP receptor protein
MALASRTDEPAVAEPAHIQELLERNLPRCRAASIRHLVKTVHLHRAPKGELLFQQGHPVALTLFITGYGAFQRTTVTGHQVTVGLANQGELFGITAVSSTISSVDMVALTDCVVGSWPGETLRQLATMDPDLALDVIDRLALFLNILTEQVDGFLHQDARRRVMRVLVRHRDLIFADPPVVPRSHLPGLVGTSREMTGRVLRDLERAGIVARDGRSGLRLLKPAWLEAGAAEEPFRSSATPLPVEGSAGAGRGRQPGDGSGLPRT